MATVMWNGKPVQTGILTSQKTSRLRVGDFVVFNHELLQVKTAQLGCMTFNGHVNSFVLESRQGETIATTSLPATAPIMKRKGRYVW